MSWFKKANWGYEEHPARRSPFAAPSVNYPLNTKKKNWSPDMKRRMPESTGDIYEYYHGDDPIREPPINSRPVGVAPSSASYRRPHNVPPEQEEIKDDMEYYRIKDLYNRFSRLKKLMNMNQNDVIQMIVEQTGVPFERVLEIARSRKSPK